MSFWEVCVAPGEVWVRSVQIQLTKWSIFTRIAVNSSTTCQHPSFLPLSCVCHCNDVSNTGNNYSCPSEFTKYLSTLINSTNLSFSCYCMPRSHFRSFFAIICLQETLCGGSVNCIRQGKAHTSIIYVSNTFLVSNLAISGWRATSQRSK